MTIQNFMSRVIPWPGEGNPGWGNLHWTTKELNQRGKPFWGGKPYKDVEHFIKMAKWAVEQDGIKDLYFCLSQQSQTTTTRGGKPTVLRLAENATALRSLWIDVDVKAPPKGYATLGEALSAITEFFHAAALPRPTAVVASGGGVHVYWISDKVLTPDEWQGYANGLRALVQKHGLRCDIGCTTDRARVLRVPGTLNHKTNPPKPVKLLYLLEGDYDFSTVLSFLPSLAPVATLAKSTVSEFFDADKFPKKFTAEKVESLAEGIEREDMPPLDIAPLAASTGCGFIREALLTGGKDYDNDLWNLTTLAATFLDDGHRFAHHLGNKHPGYSRETTDALWERKQRERHDKGIGWPSCSAIQNKGYKGCAACPHLGKIKGPLNLTHPRLTENMGAGEAKGQGTAPGLAVTATVNIALQQGLHYGFLIDKDGEVRRITEKGNGAAST